MNATIANKCLLCSAQSLSIAERLTGAELKNLWRVPGHDLSDRAMGPIKSEYLVNLYHCESCGFEFHDAALAGSAEFYEELMEQRSYPKNTPEFTFALDFARQAGLKRILDVGGGEGAFLDHAKKAGMDTFGVELNRIAAEVAAQKGHTMFNKAMQEITINELDGGVDMLTLFQVMEHVPAPVDFLRDAARLVRSGGYLVVGVPSVKAILGLMRYDPLNWPPHHISRWRSKDLATLARRSGLTLVKQGNDVLYGRAINWAWNNHNQYMSALNRSKLPGGTWLPRATSKAYRLLGCKHFMGLHGLSIYAIMKKTK